jgi:sialate O-acetylesterase
MRSVFLLLSFLLVHSAYAQIRLPRLVSDGMVLQRQTVNRLWGWASPGEKITLRFNQKKYTASADESGKWMIRLPPQAPGGPYEMSFTASNSVTVKNILFGDVWLCSGQSNIELTFDRAKYKYPDVVAHTNNTSIRQFEVPDEYDFQGPREDLAGGKWLAATPGNILKFSAVGFFFAEDLYQTYKVPIGLINAALGGSAAESWMSEEALKQFPAYLGEAHKYRDQSLITRIEAADRKAQTDWLQLLNSTDEGLKNGWTHPGLNDSNWEQMNVPGFWKDEKLGKVNGAVWFRKEVDLSPDLTGKPAEILLGTIVDVDSVFINGRFVGTISYQYPPRRYAVPAGILKQGRNVIAIRVINRSGNGGFVKDKPYELRIDGQTVDLKGSWKYRLGAKMQPAPGSTTIRYMPLGLFNAMIAPLTNYSIKGVLWYQGETNAGRPQDYASLMRALIADWRKQWNRESLPFLLVQLPNFMEARSAPTESGWAQLRQAQLQTLQVPHTGMAVTIDVGEWNDLHPLNKLDVGRRLALLAKAIVYNEKIVASGPLYRSVKRKGNKLVLRFTDIGGGLVSKDGGALKHFAIAGSDRKFVWAHAQVKGNKVIVWSDAIPDPMVVRYAWADNPEGANLYNKAGLPASPFEAVIYRKGSK